MDAARKGIVTPQMETVAKKEYRTVEEIRQLVAEGKVAIPANKHHECLNPEGIGSMLRTKINVNLGVSRDCKDYNIEMQKVMSAVNMGAEAIMDLSSHGNTQPFRQKLTHECPVMIGTVPVYDSVIHPTARSTNFHVYIKVQQTEYDIKYLLIVSFELCIVTVRNRRQKFLQTV
jgi:phosphomethylpyrimidine synthase